MPGPPIVLILADQLRRDMLGAYGDEQCPTPHLDALARRATTFARHFTPCPLGLPARGSILTGLPPRRHGAIINGGFRNERPFGTIRDGIPLLPERLLQAGYRVMHGGVQLVRTEPDLAHRLSDVEFIGPFAPGDYQRQLEQRGLFLGDMASQREPVIDHSNGYPVTHYAAGTATSVFPLREDLFFDCVVARNIVKAIQSHQADTSQPLALFANFWLPPPPLWAPQAFAHLIDPNQVTLKSTVGKWCPDKPAMHLANVPGQLGAHVPMEHWAQVWAVYMGMVALLDKCVGQILDALEETGLFEEAAILVTSNHGEMLGCHGLFQKMCLYEEAVRVPMIVKLPGQQNYRRVRDLTDHTDLTATIIDLARADPLPDTQATSMRRLAEGKTDDTHRAYVYSAYDGNAGRGFAQRMVRSPAHKLIHNIGDHAELYDLIEDHQETVNLFGHSDAAQIEQELKSALNQRMDDLDDDQPRI